jgi:hypothetical protein
MYSLIIWISSFNFHVLLICGFPFSSNGAGSCHKHRLYITFILPGECPSLMLAQSVEYKIHPWLPFYYRVCYMGCAAHAKTPIVYCYFTSCLCEERKHLHTCLEVPRFWRASLSVTLCGMTDFSPLQCSSQQQNPFWAIWRRFRIKTLQWLVCVLIFIAFLYFAYL